MRIRIIKRLPAPVMDGFNVRDLRVKHVYELDDRVGEYLITAGYAARDKAAERKKRRESARR